MKKIAILDTTLRDGEQAPGASVTLEQKIMIAKQLTKLGVDVLEPGFAIVSPGEFAAVQQISRECQGVEMVAFARAVKEDIDMAIRATQDAAKRRAHLFISSSDIHIHHQLRKSRAEVVEIARQMVAYARQFVEKIEFTPMDASRTQIDYLTEIVEAVIAEGATIINLPDTVGFAMPEEYGEMFRNIRTGARGADKVVWSAHCHNDLGLAVANSIAAIQAGASQVEVSVNGVGERTGNCSLEELVMALETRQDFLGVETNIQVAEIFETSKMVSRAMHYPIAYNKPIVGRNAFQHQSGIHQDGLIKHRDTYEIMNPEQMGIPRNMIILGKHSGRHAIKQRASEFGITLKGHELENVYTRFKRAADEKKVVTDHQLLKIVGQAVAQTVETYTLVHLQVVAGSQLTKVATVTIRDQQAGKEESYSGIGKGPLEAVIHCIRQAIPVAAQFEDLELHSLSSGEEATGEAVVTIVHEEEMYQGSAVNQDIILAAAQAYVAACNQAIFKSTKEMV